MKTKLMNLSLERSNRWVAGFFSIFSFIFLLIITHKTNIGISTDSISYIEISRNLIKNSSFELNGKLVTHWPPMFPLTHAIFANILDLDVLQSAKYLSAFLIASSILFSNLIINKFSYSEKTVIILNILIITSPAFNIFYFLWSETLFVFLIQFQVWLIVLWTEKRKINYIIIIGILSGLQFLTRYAALGIIGGITLFFLLENKALFKNKIKNAFVYIISLSIPVLAWLVYVYSNAQDLTNRDLIFHLISIDHIKSFIYTFLMWIIPIAPELGSLIVLLVIILWFYNKSFKITSLKTILIDNKIILLFLVPCVYICFLLVSITFFDFHTPLDNRILSPIYFHILLIITYLIKNVNIRYGKPSLYLITTVVFFSYFINFYNKSKIIYSKGLKYSSIEWINSETINHLSTLGNIKMYTNGADVLRLFPVSDNFSSLPQLVSATTNLRNTAFEKEMENLKKHIISNKYIIVYFDNIDWRNYHPSKKMLMNFFKDFDITRFEDGIIISNSKK